MSVDSLGRSEAGLRPANAPVPGVAEGTSPVATTRPPGSGDPGAAERVGSRHAPDGGLRAGVALVAISRAGAALARRLAAAPPEALTLPEPGAVARVSELLPAVEPATEPRPTAEPSVDAGGTVMPPAVELWIAARWAESPSSPDRVMAAARPAAGAAVERAFDGPVREVVARLFATRRGLVLFMPVGAAVRLVAPLLGDKLHDPAVVVVDDAGRFAVSLLSGHRGGANALAAAVAAALGATPVITTGAEAVGAPVAETLGREHGWRVEAGRADLVRLSAAFVNGEPVGWFQEAGEELPERAWPGVRPVPAPEPDTLRAAGVAAGVVVSDRRLGALPAGWVVYRPGTLALGVGCSRGASADEIEGLIRAVLEEGGYALASVRAIGTVALKRDELGLLEAADRLGLPLRFFEVAELATVGDLPTPSAVVLRHLGVAGVAEPAASLAAGGGGLVVPKRKTRLATAALARRAEGGLPLPVGWGCPAARRPGGAAEPGTGVGPGHADGGRVPGWIGGAVP